MSENSEMKQAIARIETNVQWIRDAMDHQVTRADKHEERIGRLERWQHWIAGGAAAIGALLGYGGANGIKS